MNAVAQLKTPPHNLDAELAVIGAIATSAEAWDLVGTEITATDFYNRQNRLAFEIARDLDAQGQTIDARTIADRAEQRGADPSFFAHLAECVELASSSRALAAYARIVRERALERRIIAAGRKIEDAGFGGATAQEKLDEAQRLVLGLTLDDDQARKARAMRDVLRDVVADVERRYNSGDQIEGLSTGFPDVDHRWLGMGPGDLVVLAGRPAMGKTTLAMNIAQNVALEGKRVMVFSLEMGDRQLAERTISARAGIPLQDIRSGNIMARPDGPPRFVEAVSRLRGLDLLIDDAAGITVSHVRGRVRQASSQDPVDLVVIDHLQLMRGENGERSEIEKFTNITGGLKSLAKELRCPVILLSQLSRECDKRPYGKNRPVMADLRSSGSIEQDADIVAFVYRNAVYRPDCSDSRVAELITAKHRNGRPGTTYLREDFEHSRFQSYIGDRPDYDRREASASDPLDDLGSEL